MVNGEEIARELAGMETADASQLLRRAVERIHAAGDDYDWVGIYMLEGDELVLDNYIGTPTDHTRIPVGRGVCGTAVAENRDINVADVTELDNYLACSLDTRSELVVLIRDGDRILGQIDIDSDRTAAFDETDARELRTVADALGTRLGEGSTRRPGGRSRT